MSKHETKAKPNTIAKLFLIGIYLLLVLILLGLCAWQWIEKTEAEEAFAGAQMELALRELTVREREEQSAKEEESAAKAQSAREELMKSLLKKDREEILMLVNPWNAIPEDYTPRLVAIGDDLYFDERAAGDLEAFLSACKAQGGAPCPLSAYRTQEYQQQLFDDKVSRVYYGGGYEWDEAYAEAAKEVALPGTSEHQTALATDIVDEYYPELDYTQAYSATQQWMMEHCTEYGFILRFPEDKQDITGIIYEPWHYRYVGKTAAKEIKELGITFEEYYRDYVAK